jgi:sigma-E factor negative regulatory protein RseB
MASALTTTATPILRRLLSALLCSVSVVAQAAAPAADNASAATWLNRLAHSSQLSYRGVLSYVRADHLESLRITHGTLNGEKFERLEHLDGDQREVIRHGQQLTCIQLGEHFNRLFQRRPLQAEMARLDPHYAIALGSEERIAGRRAITLNIAPLDAFRYGYRLALDYDTGLLLLLETLTGKGQVLERLQFVEVEIGQPLKKEWLGDSLALPDSSADPGSVERVVEEAQMPWRPQWLPPGFVLSVAPRKLSDDVLTYSDGLAVLSVFVATVAEPQSAALGKAAQGATVAVTRSTQFGGKPMLVTVVGEVPPATAARVVDSVVWDGTN